MEVDKNVQIKSKKRKWIIRQIKKGSKVKNIALAQKISRITIWKIKEKYKKYGEDGLKELCDDWGFEKAKIQDNYTVQQWVDKQGYGSRDVDA